jgi:hypothetical protein
MQSCPPAGRCSWDLEQDHGPSARIDARAQELEGTRSRHGESFEQGISMGANEITVVSRVEQQKTYPIDRTVTGFEGQSTLECLAIVGARFRLITMSPSTARQDDIPGAMVAGVREWNLSLESNGMMKARAESTKQPGVSGVTDRFSSWERADGQFEAYTREKNRCLFDRDAMRETSFDPAVLRRRHPHGAGQAGAADAAIDPGSPELVQHPRRQGATSS